MKFKIDAKELQQASKLIMPIVNINNSNVALRYLKITRNENKIEIKGYNDFIFASVFLNAYDIEGNDTCYVFAKTFFDLSKTFFGTLDIVASKEFFQIKSSKSKYKINILDENVFLETVPVEEDYYNRKFESSINLNELKTSIQSVYHCLSNDDSQMALQHVYFNKEVIIACDSIRGAIIRNDIAALDNILIHRKIIDCIMNINDSNNISFVIDNNILYGKTSNFMFSASLSGVKYPTKDILDIYEYYLKNEKKIKYNFPIKISGITEALSRILFLTDKETNSVKIVFSKDVISIVVEGNNYGEEIINLPLDIKDEMITLNVDAKNLREALSHTMGEVLWRTDGSKDIQYIVDSDVIQFFFGLEE